MKKSLSLYDQVQAAKQNVESWPNSVRLATDVRYSDIFPGAKTTNKPSRIEEKQKVEDLGKA
jgi:hypothetical protein